MAYTLEEKAVHEYRLKRAKAGLKKRKIKYYTPAALALNPDLKISQIRNVMSGSIFNEKVLVVLERLAGINTPEPTTHA